MFPVKVNKMAKILKGVGPFLFNSLSEMKLL